MNSVILSARSLCKSFAHNGTQLHILRNLDLDIYQGDFTVIMGSSGSGKSTLLYSLSGMDRASSGEITYKGKNLVTASENELAALRHSDFGFIFQQMHLVSNLTLFENVSVCGYLNKKRSSKDVDSRTEELLDGINLSDVKDHLPSQVSGGQQQRCAIARAVINDPELIFADEPTGALNKSNSTEVLNLLSYINSKGQSILMVTHDVRAALRATRLLYLEDGNIIGELRLPPYVRQEGQRREAQINAWLSSLKW